MEWLQWAKASLQYYSKGLLLEELLHYSLVENSYVSIWKRVIGDYKHQVGVIEGMKIAMEKDFKDPREQHTPASLTLHMVGDFCK
jgi:hypothetical protein